MTTPKITNAMVCRAYAAWQRADAADTDKCMGDEPAYATMRAALTAALTPEPEPLTVLRAHKDERKAERRLAQSAPYHGNKYYRLPTDTVSHDTRVAHRRQTPMAVRWTEPEPEIPVSEAMIESGSTTLDRILPGTPLGERAALIYRAMEAQRRKEAGEPEAPAAIPTPDQQTAAVGHALGRADGMLRMTEPFVATTSRQDSAYAGYRHRRIDDSVFFGTLAHRRATDPR